MEKNSSKFARRYDREFGNMATNSIQIAPSILPADFAHLGKQVTEAEKGGS